MLSQRQRFPSRGSAAAMGPMAIPLPPEAPGGPETGSGVPPQDLNGTGLREFFVGLLEASSAIRTGWTTSHGNSQETYAGTVLPQPVDWENASTAEINGDEELRAGVNVTGNAPQAANQTASDGQIVEAAPMRPAASLPSPGRI